MTRLLVIIPLLWLSALAQDADFRRQVRSTQFTRELLEKTTAQQVRDLLNVTDVTGLAPTKENLAALAAHTGGTNGQTFYVQGYATRGDWGEPRAYTLNTNSAASTNAIVIANAGSEGGRWEHQWDGDARAFGAKGDGATDAAAAINTAIAYASTSRFDKVYLPPGDYLISTTIVVRPNVLLYGDWSSYTESGSISPSASTYKSGSSAWIQLQVGANCPMIEITTNGSTYLRATASFYDGVTRNAYFVNSGVRNIGLYGVGTAQSRNDCHGITVKDAWGITIENVTMQNIRGFCIKARNVNAMRVKGCNFVPQAGRNILLDDIADVTLTDNYLFGGLGPIVWINGPSGWKNQFLGNLIGNSFSETVKDVTFFGSSITLTNHGYETGDIVMFQSTGTLPSPLASNVVFMVVKQTTNTFGISTNWLENESGTVRTLSGGSGTLQVYAGRPVGLFLSGGASRNCFTGNRFDQTYNEGVYLQGASYNAFTGNEFAECGTFGVPSATTNLIAGVTLAGASSRNTFTANVGTGNDYTLKIESGSTDNFWAYNAIQFSTSEFDATDTTLSANSVIRYDGSFGFYNGGIIGKSSLGTSLRLIGGASGGRPLVMERPGSGTNGIGVGAGSFFVNDEAATRGLFSVFADSLAVGLYLGGQNPVNTTNGRTSGIFGSPANTTLTNENLAGGTLNIYSGQGTGSGTLSRVRIFVPGTTNVATNSQPLLSLFEIRHPTTPDSTNWNSGASVWRFDGTNWIQMRQVFTNEGGLWRDFWIQAP